MTPLALAADTADYDAAVEQVRAQVLGLHLRFADQLPQWVVFGPGTSDQPGIHVARMWVLRPEPTPTNVLLRAATLAEVRDLLPRGLVRWRRQEADDPNIIEVWL